MKKLPTVLALSALTALIIHLMSVNLTMGCVVGGIAAAGILIWNNQG